MYDHWTLNGFAVSYSLQWNDFSGVTLAARDNDAQDENSDSDQLDEEQSDPEPESSRIQTLTWADVPYALARAWETKTHAILCLFASDDDYLSYKISKFEGLWSVQWSTLDQAHFFRYALEERDFNDMPVGQKHSFSGTFVVRPESGALLDDTAEITFVRKNHWCIAKCRLKPPVVMPVVDVRSGPKTKVIIPDPELSS